jgi:hypothetical protein
MSDVLLYCPIIILYFLNHYKDSSLFQPLIFSTSLGTSIVHIYAISPDRENITVKGMELHMVD